MSSSACRFAGGDLGAQLDERSVRVSERSVGVRTAAPEGATKASLRLVGGRLCARRSKGIEYQTVATKAIVGEKVGMTQVWDDQNRAIAVTVLKVAPVRVVQVKTLEREGYSALQVTWGVRRASTLTKPELGHYAAAGVDPGRHLVELRIDDCQRLRSRPAADRRAPHGGRARRRHRGVERQGLHRSDEAPQLQGSRRLPREPQEAPVAWFDRRLCHPVAGVQGHAHGRPHGGHPGHHVEPRGGPSRRRARAGPGQRGRSRSPWRRGRPAQRRQGLQRQGGGQ